MKPIIKANLPNVWLNEGKYSLYFDNIFVCGSDNHSELINISKEYLAALRTADIATEQLQSFAKEVLTTKRFRYG